MGDLAPRSMPLLNVPVAEAAAVWLPVFGPRPPPVSVHEAHPNATTTTAPVTSAGNKRRFLTMDQAKARHRRDVVKTS